MISFVSDKSILLFPTPAENFDTDAVLTHKQISVMPLTILRYDPAVYEALRSLNEM